MGFKKFAPWVLVLPLFLSACFFRTDISSKAQFVGGGDKTALSRILVGAVIERAERSNGECTRSETGVNCWFPKHRVTEVNAGIDRDGYPYIRIHSATTTLFPVEGTGPVPEKAIPARHLDWETWMIDKFDHLPQNRTRRSPNFGEIGGF